MQLLIGSLRVPVLRLAVLESLNIRLTGLVALFLTRRAGRPSLLKDPFT